MKETQKEMTYRAETCIQQTEVLQDIENLKMHKIPAEIGKNNK
jgi:hypothetical protein